MWYTDKLNTTRQTRDGGLSIVDGWRRRQDGDDTADVEGVDSGDSGNRGALIQMLFGELSRGVFDRVVTISMIHFSTVT